MQRGAYRLIRRPVDVDLPSEADSITAQLADVSNPEICPLCIYVFTAAIWDAPHERTVVRMLTTHHDFWTACARMVTAPGGTGDVSALRCVLDANEATCESAFIHRYIPRAFDDNVACLVDALCQCICAAVDSGPHRNHLNILKGKKRTWPSKPSDIMPSGVEAYVRWACVIPTPWALAILGRLLFVERPRVLPQLMRTPSRDRLVVTLVRALRQWRVSDSEFPAARRALFAHDIALGFPLQRDTAVIVNHAYYLVLVLHSGPERHLDDFGDFALGYERLLHDALVETVARTGDDDPHLKEGLIEGASILAFRGQLRVHPLVRNYRNNARDCQLYDTLTLDQAVYLYLIHRRGSRLCSGPGCERYSREDDFGGHSLSRCARCLIIQYCSTGCQRLDWKVGREDVPHRNICSVMGRIYEALVFAEGKRMPDFVAAFHDSSLVSVRERLSLARLAVTSGIFPARFNGVLQDMLQDIVAEWTQFLAENKESASSAGS